MWISNGDFVDIMFKSIKTDFSLEKFQENGGITKTINPGHDAWCRATTLDDN